MRKHKCLISIVAMLLLASLLFPRVSAAPPISRPMEFISATIEGAAPETVDPAWCYDNPSAELIFNVYETLVFFDSERTDTFIPQLATNWTIEKLPDSEVERYHYWPMQGYDQEATSFSPWVAPDTNETAWISNLPGGTVWSSPLVDDGRVFIGGSNFTAYDEENGDLLWTFRSPFQPGYASVSAAYDNMVFFGTAEPGPEGCIYALNAATGEEVWNFTTEGYVRGQPVVADGKLYVGCDFGDAGRVYCLKTSDGSHVWDYTTHDRMSSVALAYGNVYAGCGHWQTSTNAWVYCLNRTDGSEIWSFDTTRDLGGFVSIANGKVYFSASAEGSNCMVYALNATDGSVVWSTARYSAAEAGRVAVAYDKTFISLGYDSKGLYALNELNGDEVWSITGENIGGGPVVADSKVFFARGTPQANIFYAVDESDGTVLWTYALPGGVHSFSSAIANGRIFAADHYDSKLYAFGPPDRVIEIVTIPGELSPEGLIWYYRYTFEIRTGVQWHDPTYGTVSPADVEYSFERAMVQDRTAGPSWMLYEPLLNTWGAEGLGLDLTDPVEAAVAGKMIDHAVESDSTHVWFNLAFPGSYEPFFTQILSQPWSSILCKDWIVSGIIGIYGRPGWNGDWGSYTDWVAYHDPSVSPLDDPTPLMMGCGPFTYEELDYVLEQWSASRFVNYWRGWPVDWPAMAGSQPAGWVDHVVVTWAFTWPVRSVLFLSGEVDFCAVPRATMGPVLGADGIRCYYPLPMLSLDAMFFNFNIDPATPYGPIFPMGAFDETGIPSDFFGNPLWGIHTRKAFAYAFDYDTYSATAYLDETVRPATAIKPELPYHDPSVTAYPYNLTQAEVEFKMVPGLWATGFTITILYNTGNLARMTAANLIKTGIESLNPKFHVNVVSIDWRSYMIGGKFGIFPMFFSGWSADFPDPHDFAFPFYHSKGTFAQLQKYSNPAMDILIEDGIRTPDGSARQAIYAEIQRLAIIDCPSVPISEPVGRHFERDWVVGWYHNILCCGSHSSGLGSTARESHGLYFANMWKWYYVEEALESTAAQPYSSRIPVDVNYDGKVDMRDIGTTAASFGATYRPPIHPRWVFRADINCDRKVDMKDIGLVAKNFGATSPVWAPPP